MKRINFGIINLMLLCLIIVGCSNSIKSQFESCYKNDTPPNELLTNSAVKNRIIQNYSQRYYDNLLRNAVVYSPVYCDSVQNCFRVYAWKDEKYNNSNSIQLRYFVKNDSLAATLMIDDLEIDKSGDNEYCSIVELEEYIEKITEKANQGKATAQFLLGQYYSTDLTGIDRAIEYYTKAAEQGHAQSCNALGNLVDFSYEFGTNERNIPYIENAAECGNGLAQFDLWIKYAMGKDVGKNEQRALYWLKRSSEQSLVSIISLGELYAGESDIMKLEKDDKKAIVYFTLAAKENSEEAYYWLGEILSTSNQVTRNYSKALEYFQKSADLGHVESMMRLGEIYTIGNTELMPQQDLDKALKYFRGAAEQGDPTAQIALALLLTNQLVPPTNPSDDIVAEGKKWEDLFEKNPLQDNINENLLNKILFCFTN